MKSKKELIEDLNQACQRSGTLTVIHTNAVANKIGLSATEFESMDIISRYQPMSAGQLSTCCGLTSGAITGIIDRLERAGFVRRKADPRDRRRVLLEPIEDRKKSRKIRELYRPMGHAFEAATKDCTPEQIEFMIKFVNRMNQETEKVIVELREK